MVCPEILQPGSSVEPVVRVQCQPVIAEPEPDRLPTNGIRPHNEQMEAIILDSVRDELLTEARHSPGLLADLANLERYVAETYSARSFIELLQNADDASASRFLLLQEGGLLICANDGRPFSRSDFYSLCRSASSDKKRGYRGICLTLNKTPTAQDAP